MTLETSTHATPVLALDVVAPVFNEQATLESSIRRLHDYLTRSVGWNWRITIADNASSDETPRQELRRRLAVIDLLGSKGDSRVST